VGRFCVAEGESGWRGVRGVGFGTIGLCQWRTGWMDGEGEGEGKRGRWVIVRGMNGE